MALTDKCLGTRWWAFAGLEDLEGLRLRAWHQQAEEAAETEMEKADPDLYEEMEKERKEKYGDGPVTMGEDPVMLVMVPENNDVTFDVV